MDGILPFPPRGHIEPMSYFKKTVDGVAVDVRTFDEDPAGRCRLCPLCGAFAVQDGRYQCAVPSRPAALLGGGGA